MPVRVPVLLPYPFAGPFDYLCPPELDLQPGDIVLVPLNRRAELGVVWDESGLPDGLASASAPPVPAHKLKPVTARMDGPPIPRTLRRFVDWVAAYTLSPPGLVLAMAMRAHSVKPETVPVGWVRSGSNEAVARDTPARGRVLAVLADGRPRPTAALAREAEVSAGVIRSMGALGLLREAPIDQPAPFALPDIDHQAADLSPNQASVADTLGEMVRARRFQPVLLDGVTGSGKTETYLEAIAACIADGRQALVLLPEIALSSQWLQRFARRFGTEPAIWHSELGSARRRVTWRAVSNGEAPVVVGARSALFLPFPDLGLVIVDEEHETAFKQEDGVTYHARDMAVVRARLANAPAVLVSATPSLETLHNVEQGRYRHLTLLSRHGGARLPSVSAIDMREFPPERGRFLSPRLIQAAADTMRAGEQAMLFLNRRGYAPLTLCRTCGHRISCPNCTAWLVEHRARKQLCCHHCGHTEAVPVHCPECQAENSLTPIGPGVERITEEARETFPDARILVMASDTLPGPKSAAEAVRRIADREVDLVIGTQIVAKGWHFPGLTLVGVVDADLGLGGGDLRAAERTVQLLHQVAGRAGRAQAPGQVLLQTYTPEHPVMQALVANDFGRFMQREAAERRPGHWPPYGRLAALIVSADSATDADHAANALGRCAPRGDGIEVLGPAPAPLAILRGRHRRRLLLRTRRDTAVQPILVHWLHQWRQTTPSPRSVIVDVDVDPISFL
ncbi:primosomal protein N' [Acetobacteraceae bacterium KSS8]|uniref:Replication restart protein PriA n=1 Tax=Endosaccharibacter trunci TaxID=2812733 RepID=A0ABT1W5M3_9PROT|nr:primosomal protein N' [Acetobacteraceae bacterium KSS8]